MNDYIILFAIVLGVNLIPAFGPPTWTILVLYSLNTRMPTPAVVLTGASAAALGRYLLATAFGLISSKFSTKSRDNLDAAKKLIEQSKSKTVLALTVFVISPLPSAQLFETAGLMRVGKLRIVRAGSPRLEDCALAAQRLDSRLAARSSVMSSRFSANSTFVRSVDSVGWALFFMWVGVALLANLSWTVSLIGTAAIILVVQATLTFLSPPPRQQGGDRE